MGCGCFFLFRFPAITNDSFVYGDIAKNWLQHGIYGLSGPDEISPTYIRLPGYPAFLAAVFAIFGMEHYRAVLVLQMFVDIATCFLIADMARRLVSPRAAKAAFLLAALCPFLASYAAAALTETLEIFFTVLAFDCAIAGLETLDQSDSRRGWGVGSLSAPRFCCVPMAACCWSRLSCIWLVLWCVPGKTSAGGCARCHAVPAHLLRAGLILRVRLFGAAGSVGLAQSAHHASLSAAGAALRQ